MASLDVSTYSSEELRRSRDSQTYMSFINACFGTMHSRYHCFDTPRFSSIDEFYDDFKDQLAVLAVARDRQSQEIVAVGGYRPLENKTAELKCLCVDENQGGKGYGSFMNTCVEELARVKGYEKMNSVVVRQHGNLVEFYQKLGYTKQAEQKLIAGGDDMGFGNIIDIDIWHMQKDLKSDSIGQG